jgi:quinol monooxygenase YgiN
VSLHATICRYDGVTASIDEVMRAGRQLASALSEAPGFVSYAVLDAGDGVVVFVTVFDDPADLAAADQFIDRWVAEHLTALLSPPPEVIVGEVIVQRGM